MIHDEYETLLRHMQDAEGEPDRVDALSQLTRFLRLMEDFLSGNLAAHEFWNRYSDDWFKLGVDWYRIGRRRNDGDIDELWEGFGRLYEDIQFYSWEPDSVAKEPLLFDAHHLVDVVQAAHEVLRTGLVDAVTRHRLG